MSPHVRSPLLTHRIRLLRGGRRWARFRTLTWGKYRGHLFCSPWCCFHVFPEHHKAKAETVSSVGKIKYIGSGNTRHESHKLAVIPCFSSRRWSQSGLNQGERWKIPHTHTPGRVMAESWMCSLTDLLAPVSEAESQLGQNVVNCFFWATQS